MDFLGVSRLCQRIFWRIFTKASCETVLGFVGSLLFYEVYRYSLDRSGCWLEKNFDGSACSYSLADNWKIGKYIYLSYDEDPSPRTFTLRSYFSSAGI